MPHTHAQISGRIARTVARCVTLAGHLLRDRAGNTIVMVAAAILPLMALVGSGIDMGRAYLVQSRACNAPATRAC